MTVARWSSEAEDVALYCARPSSLHVISSHLCPITAGPTMRLNPTPHPLPSHSASLRPVHGDPCSPQHHGSGRAPCLRAPCLGIIDGNFGTSPMHCARHRQLGLSSSLADCMLKASGQYCSTLFAWLAEYPQPSD